MHPAKSEVPANIEELATGLRGQLIRPGDDAYDQARSVWNAMIDKRPRLIVRCAGVADVLASVRFAREQGLDVAVRGGSHNVAGNATCDDGVVIDLSPMKSVRVDPITRVARAEAGLTWGEYDHETQAFGLATPGGAISTTGIAGLTLGGGFGWLSRSYGMVCDNVLSMDVVTADGRFLTASEQDHADLFWGLRGGGGNFGVTTSFEYRLHLVGPMLSGLVIHPRSEAKELLRFFAEFTAEAPDELASMAVLLNSPDGEPVAAVFVAYNGPAEAGERVLAPLRRFGSPLVDDIDIKPYTVVQQTLDAGFPAGRRNYWKSNFLTGLGEECIDVLVEHAARAPSPFSAVGIEHTFGGAAGRIGREDTAFDHRDVGYNLIVLGMWEGPTGDDANITWARNLWTAAGPFSAGSVYVNYLNWEEADRIKDAYGSTKYRRLADLKTKYDPTNLFHLNQNIAPAG